MGDRAVAPVVGKTLEIGIGVLFVSLLAIGIFGGVVPEYRTVAADGVAERTLAGTAHTVADLADRPSGTVRGRATEVQTVPATIRGRPYEISMVNGTVSLQHPHPGIGGHRELGVASDVTVTGAVGGVETIVITATYTPDGTTVTLEAAR